MRGSEKSRRVTWASDFNLCQVRLFLTEEPPSQVAGAASQDHLQAKISWVSHSTGTASEDVLPPGFELGQPSNPSQIKASDVPVIKWRCPPRFAMATQWVVVAGEESQDVEAQNQREMRVLEAVYPRPSAIPTNPAFPGETEGSQHNDYRVPLIPITPIEDEDSSDVVGPTSSQQQQTLSAPGLPPQFASTAAEPDVVAAASAAFAAINRSSEQGSLIDHDLLIKILSNPKLIEKLVKDHGAAAATSAIQNSKQPFVASSEPFYGHASMAGRGIPSGPNVQAAPPPVPFMNIPPPAVAISTSSGGPPPPVKDFSYYKTLIQQHGGERQQDRYGGPQQQQQQQQQHQHQQQQRQQQDQLGYSKSSKDSKTKTMKPCLYFNSSRGCRNGANCAYQHDNAAPPQQRGNGMSSSSEMQSSKRMKMDREISS